VTPPARLASHRPILGVRGRSGGALALVAAPLALGLGCAEPEPPWYTQLVADSPCYRVNLADGLDEADPAELYDLFACLNHHGHLRALEPTVEALSTPSRDGRSAALELARAGNALGRADVDLMELGQGLLGAVELPAHATTQAQDIALELVYGRTAIAVRREDFDLRSADHLTRGAIVPLRPALPELAGSLLDDHDTRALAGDLLVDPETHRWIRTVASWASATDPRIARPLDDLLPDLGRAIVATRSPGNDRWPSASGDSLRDVLDAATRRRARGDLLDVTAPQVAAMLGDRRVRRELPAELARLQRAGHLGQAIAQLTWLTQINVDGDLVGPGQDSALHALLRLMYATNRPMQCRVDIWFTVIDVDLGNLAVGLLRVLADQDPDDVQSAAGLFGRLLGYGLGDGVLQSIADAGTCPVLTTRVVRDLSSLDRLSEPSARDLTHTLVGLLRTLKYGDRDNVPEVVDLISEAWLHGVTPPLEEVLRDLGESRAWTHLTALVPVMDRPEAYGVSAGDEPAKTLSDLLELSAWLAEPVDGRTGWQRLRPLIVPMTRHDGTFDALHRTAGVLGDRGSALSHAHDLLPMIVQADPELRLLTQLAPLVSDPDIAEPLLRVAELPPLTDALLAVEPAGDHPDVPLAFAAHLIRSGTVDDLFRILKLIVDDLRQADLGGR